MIILFYEKVNGEKTIMYIWQAPKYATDIALAWGRGPRRVIKEDEKIVKQVLVTKSGGHENHA